MESPTKLDRLVAANIIYSTANLTEAQRAAIETLTEEEVDALISVKAKLADHFPVENQSISPVQHHN